MGWKLFKLPWEKRGKKTITYGELIDAMEANGLEQTFRQFWATNGGIDILGYIEDGVTVSAACALGQGALNLGLGWSNYADEIDRLGELIPPKNKNTKRSLSDVVMSLNDEEQWGIKSIARYLRRQYRNYLNQTLQITPMYRVDKS